MAVRPMGATLEHQAANPEVITRQGERSTEQGGEEGQDACYEASPTAVVEVIDKATHLLGTLLCSIGDLSAP